MQKKLWLVLLLLAVSCGHVDQDSSNLNSSSLDPKPENPEDLISQMRRFLGQEKFVNVDPYSRGPNRARSLSSGLESAAMDKGGSQRAIQESDVFKFDPTNANRLYLLNNYRGLQRIDFSEGLEQAKLDGRAPATGNYPDNMYFYNKGQKNYALVVENNWYDPSSDLRGSSQSRVVVYDADSLELLKTVSFAGELADHRMVGDILYVATSEWPSYSWWDWSGRANQSSDKGKGHIYSVDLASRLLDIVDQKVTSLPISRRENLNIVEVQNGDKYQYFAVATLSNSRWGFWDQTSVVEVLDITSPEGHIQPVMIAKPQGFVEERSQTLIKDDTLIVVSNYTPAGDNAKGRVAVETFKFPTKNSKKIDQTEAEYRVAHIERAMRRAGLTFNSPNAVKILEDKETGLRDVFVEIDGKLSKLVSDSFSSYGDTNGLHAVLRDVRVSGNSLYAFWVPSDRQRLFNDPLEIFDISQPRTGVSHVDHLEFPGRIDRAFPITYDNKNYILALGVVEPGENNEAREEHGRAMLVEIIKRGKIAKAIVSADLKLASPKLRPNFQSQDKLVTLRFTEEGRGFILFEAQQRDNWWMNGGKLIGFDLNVVEEGGDVFSEGAFIPAEEGYLKRVFENVELEALHSFTDRALASFKPAKSASSAPIGAANEVLNAVQVLELARNIRGYVTLDGEQGKTGIQIIDTRNWYDRDYTGETELRYTSVEKADAELSDTAVNSLKGSYVGHYVSVDGKTLVVVTQTEKWVENENGYRHRQVDATLAYKVRGGEVSEAVQISDKPMYGEFLKAHDQVLFRADEDLVSISIPAEGQIEVTQLSQKGCQALKDTYPQLKEYNGELYYTHSKHSVIKDKDIGYTTHYLTPVSLTEKTLSCGKSVNVPGDVVSVSKDLKTLITYDQNLKVLSEVQPKAGERNRNPQYNIVTKTNLVALALDLNKGVASLRRLDDIGTTSAGALKSVGDALVFVDTDEQNGGFMPMMGLRASVAPWRGGYRVSQSYSLSILTVDADYNFLRTNYALKSEEGEGSSVQLSAVLKDATEGDYVALTTQGRFVRAYSLNVASGLGKSLKLQSVDEKFKKQRAKDSIELGQAYYLGGYSYYGHTPDIQFDPEQRSVEVAAGDAGVLQFYIGK